jgi:hypothetical protein
LGGEVEPVLVGLRDGDLEPLTDRLPPLTRCEPAAHEVGSLSIRPDGLGRHASAQEPSLTGNTHHVGPKP